MTPSTVYDPCKLRRRQWMLRTCISKHFRSFRSIRKCCSSCSGSNISSIVEHFRNSEVSEVSDNVAPAQAKKTFQQCRSCLIICEHLRSFRSFRKCCPRFSGSNISSIFNHSRRCCFEASLDDNRAPARTGATFQAYRSCWIISDNSGLSENVAPARAGAPFLQCNAIV